MIRKLLLTLILLVMGCQTTPVLMGGLREANDKTVALYMACSSGANYLPTQMGCDPFALENQVLHTMDLAKNFVAADIKQPHGYDIYLSTVMIYFRIGQRNSLEYTEAERIARQFFEVQKASSTRGKNLTDARFYWVQIATGHAAWQWFNNQTALTSPARKADLRLCFAEGMIAFQVIPSGPRKVRLSSSLQNLKAILSALK